MKKLLALASSLCFVSAAALGASADATVKVRQKFMSGLGAHAAVIGMATKMKVGDPNLIESQAEALAAAGKNLLEMFPQGSLDKKSHAKAEIWKNWKDFEAKNNDLQKATEGLLVAAKTKDSAKIGQAFEKVGESCKGCHKTYKQPERD